jgi:hypothetical protein
MPNTFPANLPYPNSFDPVANGAQNIEDLAEAVNDGGGLWKVASGTLSGNAVNFVGCFTTRFRNYRIVFDSVTFTGSGDVYYQFLSGSTPNTTSNYYWAYSGLTITNAATGSTIASSTIGYTGMSTTVAFNLTMCSASMDVYAPLIAQRTFITSAAVGHSLNFYHRHGIGGQNELLAFDGIRFLTNLGPNFTGNVTIYGYRN